ncbi:FAD-dependent monooxygenase [Microbacterium sp. 179-I 3D2 NHS]|uniref:FAD-dependent monooxygenase n=1 Tax=Microbacterium sp. 179-I 3D2 NHS TaxID=3235178 RepID=UPI0039A2F696
MDASDISDGPHTPPATDEVVADVLIVGAGPVGLVLATELARRGVRLRIIDSLPAPTTESRAIVVHSRSLDHLRALGAWESVMSHAIEAHGMQMHSGEKTVAEVSFDDIAAVYRYSAALAQTDTEAALAGRLAELGATVERSTTLTAYSQDAEGVDARVTAADGSIRTVRARYLVGADGARSAVRHLTGQKLEGSFVGEDFLLGDVEGDHDYDRSLFHTFFSPGQSTGLLFALPGDRVRVFAQLPPGTDPHRPATVDWLQEALLERGIRLRIRESHWITRVTLKHGQVPRYRDGRVFLAGDAAHIHSPAGGLGMNTGMQDALNLAWKLHAALGAVDDTALLDSYHDERHPVAADVIRFTTRLSDAGTLSNPVAQRVRNALLHIGLSIPAVEKRIAGTVEQQNVRYRDSAIVTGEGRMLRPGDYLFLEATSVADALAQHPSHLAILLPGRGEPPRAVLPAWLSELTVTDDEAERLRQSTGLADGGLLIVRPDGYLGHIGPDVPAGIDAYGELIGYATAG